MTRIHPEVRQLLKALLDVIDNLERAVEAAESEVGEGDASALGEGVRGIHRQLTDLLYRYEVRGYSSQGARFDPARHEAMGQVRTEEFPPRHVAREVRRGYLLGEELFRASQVLVSAEPTAEHGVVAGNAGRVSQKPTKKAAERSAPNRPSWLLNPPASSDATLYLVGRTSAAKDAEAGQQQAREAALCELRTQLNALSSEEALADIFAGWAKTLAARPSDGLWTALVERLPEAEDWVEDFYWEQVEGEIRGRSYDVAVLLAVPKTRAKALLERSGGTERWGGLELTDLGPLESSLIGGLDGALLLGTHLGGVGTRAGLKPGDIVIRVGPRHIEGAASARRLLTQSGNARRPFEVEYVRDLGPPMTVRVEPLRRR